ncbi:hypothetical protein [Paraburkholderia caribensis]|uniref:hypothetical protein n=1 Tax=Paraburkholderia caribensis TaxID=75105 RepID=UPI00071FD889|nr:hypothetical protein [Paraburkholderia caribensis]ALP65197.1 hypothetical protein AN416_21615 [Paraburkholderia caribensis]AUT53650.1 hypothetical protein C2L66_16875 [Paraburkholderia caribensis]
MKHSQLEDYVSAVSLMLKMNPAMIALAKRNPTFPKAEKLAVVSIADADSLVSALRAHDNYAGLVPDWKFVFASTHGATPGLAVSRTFSDGAVVRGLFATDHVFVLDGETMESMKDGDTAIIPIDYSISLDTQALSYLTPYLEGNKSKIPRDFDEIFSFLAKDCVNVDPVPYMTENLPNILSEKNVPKIRRRLNGYEMLRTIDEPHFRSTKVIRSTLDDRTFKRNVDEHVARMLHDASDSELMGSLNCRHACVYATLLKMAIIQIGDPRRLLSSKLEEFMEFMDHEMQTIFARETVIAEKYFRAGQNLKFFGRLQRSSESNLPKVLRAAKNMAWDFLHIRNIEDQARHTMTTLYQGKTKPRYFFPSFLTTDKDFIEVIDAYPLKSYAYETKTGRLNLFPALNWHSIVAGEPGREEGIKSRFFSDGVVRRRELKRNSALERIHETVRKLEVEFREVVTATRR